jgi:NhaP-type Na+/H+ or K+/H+ antiporter
MAFISSYSLKQSYEKLSTSFDNFDIIMMLLSPLVSYLMAETFTISGLLALMCCAFIQSIYAKENLEKERSNLLLSTFRALSYSCRSICDILMGIGFALHFDQYVQIGPLYVILSILII